MSYQDKQLSQLIKKSEYPYGCVYHNKKGEWNEKEKKSGCVAVDFHARPDPDIPSGSEGSVQWK